MIGVVLRFGGEVIEVRVQGINVYFRSSTYGTAFVPFENLHLDKAGVVKEFPDLDGDEQWRQKAIERFRAEMKKLGSENKVADYIINDLKKYGYKAIAKQRQGFRVQSLEDEDAD